jgi:hypothetical protein
MRSGRAASTPALLRMRVPDHHYYYSAIIIIIIRPTPLAPSVQFDRRVQ